MHPQLRQAKTPIRQFMRDHYTDDKLLALLDHARAGKLHYCSCCCFIGIATATHALAGYDIYSDNAHLMAARALPGGEKAEKGFLNLLIEDIDDDFNTCMERDALRSLRLIPMILAEIRRRNRLRMTTITTPVDVLEHVGL